MTSCLHRDSSSRAIIRYEMSGLIDGCEGQIAVRPEGTRSTNIARDAPRCKLLFVEALLTRPLELKSPSFVAKPAAAERFSTRFGS